ncbi:MAG: response regulator [Nitrospirae bacterium]|nr:response regulator [Nitrospirota bacterium]MBI5695836.1 response regulator [Nitrospirota bacterium]
MSAKKILVVDDEMHIVRIVKYKLETAGYHVISALNGTEALKMAREEKPDLIFLDIMMPGLNGYEVCSQLKNSPETRNIIIIMLTAKGQESDKIKGLEVGVDEYITKPFSPQDLLDRTRDLLG